MAVLEIDENIYALATESMQSADEELEEKRKEEAEKRLMFDTDDRNRVYEELMKHSHPLKITSQASIASLMAKWRIFCHVQIALKMGESMFLDFRSSIPGGFDAPLKRKVKTMESIKCGVAIGDKTLYVMASLIRCLIIVGQHRHVERQTLFDYELCAVPAVQSLMNMISEDWGQKSTLVSKLKVDELQPDAPDIAIVDGQQLLILTPPTISRFTKWQLD